MRADASSSGATNVAFKKVVLSLKVKPSITPDGRILMAVDVNKDQPNTRNTGGFGVAIDTRHVKTEVLVENGGTVVIGGIFEETVQNAVAKVPLLGDLPVLGALFRRKDDTDNKSELLVFLTPRIVSEAATLR